MPESVAQYIDKLEVLFVSHKYPPATGGMEKQSYELVEGMQAYATVHRIVLEPGQGRFRFFWGLEKRILKKLAEFPGISVIHFNDALIAAVSLRHRSYKHLKRVVTVHGLDVVFPNRIFQERVLPRFNDFDKIIAVSHATAQACIDRGLNPDKIEIVLNGVSHDLASFHENRNPEAKKQLALQYGFDPDLPIILAMGRTVKRKGFSWFISSVLPRLEQPAQFLMIGPFAFVPSITEQILGILPNALRCQLELLLGFPTDQKVVRQYLSTKKRIRHLGRLPFVEMVKIVQSADVFVMPNIHVDGDMEGFGLVCLEAAILGLPVFAADIDGITDAILHEQNGILLPSESATAWAHAIDGLLQEPSVYREKAKAWSDFTLAHYSWQLMVQRYYEVFLQLDQEL